MMGRKKLSAIRAELRQEITRSAGDPDKALDRLIQKVKSEPAPDKREIEALRMLRAALARLSRPARKKGRPIAG